jgi:hypothetical protein
MPNSVNPELDGRGGRKANRITASFAGIALLGPGIAAVVIATDF